MKRNRLIYKPEQTEINVSPLIDMVFILLIFFIVSTSFIDEVGISSNYKDSDSNLKQDSSPIFFTLPGSGQIISDKSSIDLEGVRQKVKNSSNSKPPSIIIQVKKGARAGLATQVMDQALIAGAKAVKIAAID